MPRLGSANVTNAVPQRTLFHQKVLTAEQALSLGATEVELTMGEHSGTEGFQQLLRPSSVED